MSDIDRISIKTSKTERLIRASGTSAIVALSGGVDSAVLLAIAIEALGRDRVLAVTGRSPSLASAEARDAARVARHLGCRHRFVDTGEIEDPKYSANRGDRCFHCRSHLFGVLRRIAEHERFEAIAYGAIRDDLSDDRPGMRAAETAGVIAPLLEAGWTKEDVRASARSRGLPVHEKPASACLASRIPTGTAVTPNRLASVERAEQGLRTLGLSRVRVRHHGDIARIELGPKDIEALLDPRRRAEAAGIVRGSGFRYVTLDLDGYRPGGTALSSGEATRGSDAAIVPIRDKGA